MLCVLSRIAPAVLGRDSGILRDGLADNGREETGSIGADAGPETIDDILPETECPGLAVIVLDVSLETRDNGRGMYSMLSENPTRARGAGFVSGAPPVSDSFS